MTSSRKRLAYDSDTESNPSSDEEYEYYPEKKYSKYLSGKKSLPNESVKSRRDRQPTRVPTVFNRNAVMARKNRIKKKQYMDNLEKDIARIRDQNSKLNSIMNNQSFVIAGLRKELKYVRSVLTNSTAIAQLLATIQRNTGMSVNSSILGRSAPIKSECISKPEASVLNPPWEESTSYPSFPTPDSPNDMFNLDLPFSDNELMSLPLSDDFPLFDIEEPASVTTEPSKLHLSEHNYTSNERTITDDDDDEGKNIGICLHVSNQRVSLEFCSTCNDNAINNWNEIDN